jgi:hypothetical protein
LLCAIAITQQTKREVGALRRDVARTSAIQWIGQACHNGAMARSQESQRRVSTNAQCDDLYDYAVASARLGRRRAKRTSVTWTVTDDWSKDVPVTEAEIDMFEAWFGDLFDELFGKS